MQLLRCVWNLKYTYERHSYTPNFLILMTTVGWSHSLTLIAQWPECNQNAKASWPTCKHYSQHSCHMTWKMNYFHFIGTIWIYLVLWRSENALFVRKLWLLTTKTGHNGGAVNSRSDCRVRVSLLWKVQKLIFGQFWL